METLTLSGTIYNSSIRTRIQVNYSTGIASFKAQQGTSTNPPNLESVCVPFSGLPVIRSGIDSSGNTYRVVEWTGALYYDGHGKPHLNQFSIQFWQDNELFLSGWRKPIERGKGFSAWCPYGPSGFASEIVTLDPSSTSKWQDFIHRLEQEQHRYQYGTSVAETVE